MYVRNGCILIKNEWEKLEIVIATAKAIEYLH